MFRPTRFFFFSAKDCMKKRLLIVTLSILILSTKVMASEGEVIFNDGF